MTTALSDTHVLHSTQHSSGLDLCFSWSHAQGQEAHGFLGNGWTTTEAVVGGAHDHEVGPSGVNQEEEPTVGPMDLITYNPSKDRGLVYSHFERMVLNQLHKLNVS